MKFFWKIFLAFIVLITVVFSFFGIWIISFAFKASFEREIEEGNKENRMFQYTFEVNMNPLSEMYWRENILEQMSSAIVDNLDNKFYIYTIFNEQEDIIFTSREKNTEQPENDIIGTLTEENNCGYEIVASGDKRILYFVSRSEIGDAVFYLESAQDITEIYSEREKLFDSYRMVMLALLVCTAAIIFVISHILTKNIVDLSYSTRKFARGDYQIRANVSGGDEVAMLAEDFNKMADNLAEKMEDLTEAVRKQEDFTASFAHELKTPLTSIIGYADMLRTMDMDKEETMQAANYIFLQGKRLESLSFKLLELIVTERHDYDFKILQTEKVVDEVAEIVSTSLEKKNIVLHKKVEKGTILGEHDLLISMMVNLVDNARKALPEDGHVWIKGRQTEKGYEFSVVDNGCGMPKEEIEKITEAFYMVDKSRARKEGGAGLGMTLCSKIVALHNAQWVIKSKEGEGTAIWILFPSKEGENERK